MSENETTEYKKTLGQLKDGLIAANGMRLEGLYRVDVPEISVPAVREALINAFCHRDYHDPDEVRVAIFKDRVEIRNPGRLFGGLTIEDLRRGNVSMRRNPLIADLFLRIQMVEAWGRGMPLILDNEPNTQFREVAGLFITSFPRPSFEPDYAAKAVAANGQRTPKKNLSDSNTITKTITKAAQEQFSPTESTIFELVKNNPTITLADMATRLGMSVVGVRYHTDSLQAKGCLRRIGRRYGHWEIIEDFNSRMKQ
jgi:ATP-dependent DNA helicase RecG